MRRLRRRALLNFFHPNKAGPRAAAQIGSERRRSGMTGRAAHGLQFAHSCTAQTGRKIAQACAILCNSGQSCSKLLRNKDLL
jgi:hypothetical protein